MRGVRRRQPDERQRPGRELRDHQGSQSVIMRAEEVVNFHIDGTDVATFSQRMRSHAEAAWKSGRRSLASIADYLNVQDVRTACGLAWNERRVYLLLKVIFYEPSRASADPVRVRHPQRTVQQSRPLAKGLGDKTPIPVSGRKQVSSLDLSRLSKLGRIVERKPRG